MMLGQPDRIEAQLLRRDRLGERLLVTILLITARGPLNRVEETKLHAHPRGAEYTGVARRLQGPASAVRLLNSSRLA